MKARRGLLAALVAATLLAAAPAYAAGPGYTLETSNLLGSPYHQHIWLPKYAWGDYWYVNLDLYEQAIQLRAVGVDISYDATAGGPWQGRITVNRLGYCSPGVASYTASVIVSSGGKTWIQSSSIDLCPLAFTDPGDPSYLLSILKHEMGHALGLGHYLPLFDGALQIMYPTVTAIRDYQYGDLNGLTYLATHRA